jgi:hypothetical protein
MAARQFASGTSAAGAGLSSLGALLQQFLSMRMGMQEKDKDRQVREKELADQKEMDQKRIDLEGKRVGLEEQSQRTAAAGALRGQLPGGAYDDPSQVSAIAATFKGTPYEGLFQNKSTLPSTKFSDAGVTSDEGGKPYGFLQPTTQEQRDQLLMKMEQARDQREATEAPLRQKVLQNQAATTDPAYLEKRLKEQHGFDMQEIQARIRETASAGKKTSIDDDLRMYISGMHAASDPNMSPADSQVMKTAMGVFWQAMKTKYPQLKDVAQPNDEDNNKPDCDMKDIDPGTGKCKAIGSAAPPAGPSLMDRIKQFLSQGSGSSSISGTPSGRISIY